MPFIPHTKHEIETMLSEIGVSSIDALFDEIPSQLKAISLNGIPEAETEMALNRLARERAKQDECSLCFIGAGAYEHHIPAAVWEIATRGEYMTAYTPYQAEASQGGLQLIYEYQTMMASLMAMEVSNASMYEGASALAEAILMAARIGSKQGRCSVLFPATIHPLYRHVIETIVGQQGIQLIIVPYEEMTGQVDQAALTILKRDDTRVMVIPQPNFFGVIEDVDALTRWANAASLITIGLVNPIAMALLKPPGLWGDEGVDIACGEGQSLGIPMASGGPYYGFLCTKKKHVRQMPGRLVGRTNDIEGKQGFVLTLQAREQHIRRAKATSNICTNQGLMVTASTIYMSLMGPQGMHQVALACHEQLKQLRQALNELPGIEFVFLGHHYHELVVRFDKPVHVILHELAALGIQGGYSLETHYPELKNTLLICVTETKTNQDIQQYIHALRAILVEKELQCHA